MSDPNVPPQPGYGTPAAPYGNGAPYPGAQPAPIPPAPAFGEPAPVYGAPAPAHPASEPAAPPYAAPPGAYPVPVGGYAQTPAPEFVNTSQVSRGGNLGVISLVLGLIVCIVTPIASAVLMSTIGYGAGTALIQNPSMSDPYAALTTVRDEVLAAEIIGWISTALGIGAIVFGIMAIAKRARRGMGIAGLILGILAPLIVFGVGLAAFLVGAGGAGFSELPNQ